MNGWSLARPLLFALPPETAHRAARGALKAVGCLPAGPSVLDGLYCTSAKPKRVAGLEFRNPVGLAAGFDKDGTLAELLPRLGFGFIELGTFTWHPQPGSPKPRLFRLKERAALLNRMGFNNPGALEAARTLSRLTTRPVPIGINIGKSAIVPIDEAAGDYFKSLETLKDLGDYYVLNISSPNTADLRRLHEGPRLEALLTGALERVGKRPLFVKVSPDLDAAGLEALALLCVRLGVGIIATNTTVSREGLGPEWQEQAGGLSGPPLKEKALASLRKLREHTQGRVPLIGVGGIATPQDAKERLEAGADLIQIYTGWIYQGPGLVKSIVEAL